ncbi:hypothetical protein GEV33_001867 [Tenebrio molitor]|uniref:Uncharacterized protein n=1 Tax=Tenebrio molitor TaxID=7067 RepID=A0A8J6HUI1_TENMO|nr:hypothetical protein GEV33_001867 [Tenebrio molitor]
MPLLPQTSLQEEPTSYNIASTPATSNQSGSHREDYLSQNTKKGRIFSKEGTFAGPWMCVNVIQELTVGWWKEERHSSDATAKSAGFESRPHGPPMDVVLLYSCCVVQKRRKEKGGWPWVAGESTPEPRRTT